MERSDKVVTRYIHPPIPVRHFDWVAWIDGEEDGPHGNGTTEQEAESELLNIIADELEIPEPYPLASIIMEAARPGMYASWGQAARRLLLPCVTILGLVVLAILFCLL